MQITLITTELSPLHDGAWSEHAAALCAALSNAGHDLLVVAPLPSNSEPSRLGLARRLTPFELVRGSQTIPIVRFEGKLPNGARLTALAQEPDQGAIETERWFPAAAAQWIQAEAEDASWHLTLGSQSPSAAAWLLAGGMDRVGMVIDASHQGGWPAARDAMSKVRWIAALSDEGKLSLASSVAETLARQGLNGRLHMLPLPALVPAVRSSPVQVSKNKATLQFELGLPVSPTVPLVLIDKANTPLSVGVLRCALRHGLQVICLQARTTPEIAELQQTYPDRLVCPVDELHREQIFRQVDACVAFDDTELAYQAALCNAVPIVAAQNAGVLTELSADCESGSAVVATALDVSSFDEALARFASLADPRRLDVLRGRLAACVPSWPRTAAHLVELMSE